MKKFKIVYLVFILTAIFTQEQQGLALDNKTDKTNVKSSGKIAVASVGKTETSAISDQAGRAPYILIFNCNGIFIKAIKNPAQNKKGQASAIVTSLLKKESVTTFIAANFGAKMENNLKAARIAYYQHSGSAKEAVKTIIKNKKI